MVCLVSNPNMIEMSYEKLEGQRPRRKHFLQNKKQCSVVMS